MSQGRIIIVSGPSGVGKGTILRTVMQQHESLHYSVSATSRPMRPEDREGVSYYFVSRERFEEMIAAGELLEHACYAGNYYGTPLRPVEEALARGESVVLEIDVQGALQVMQRRPGRHFRFHRSAVLCRAEAPAGRARRHAAGHCRQTPAYRAGGMPSGKALSIYHHQRFRRARRAGAGSSPDRGGLPYILSPTQSQGGRLIMLYPAMADLLKHIDSRYLLVNVIARRARQISIEAETEHIPLEDKPVTIAIHEVADGKLAAVVKE